MPGQPVSRVLSGEEVSSQTVFSCMIISLGGMSPCRSSSLPGTLAEAEERAAPRVPSLRRTHYPCLALLRMGVAWPAHCCAAGGLLHRRFTLAPLRKRYVSVALSHGCPRRGLPAILPCAARTFLGTTHGDDAIIRPAWRFHHNRD